MKFPSLRKIRIYTNQRLSRIYAAINPRRMIINYEEYCGDIKGKALVSYLIDPLIPPPSLRNRTQFSNRGLAQYIPRALNELGYSVDIVNYDTKDPKIKHSYDLFLGHGGINFEAICRQIDGDPIKIYFSTGIYWREFNLRESERLMNFTGRTGFLVAPDRSIDYSEEYANQNADGIICLGNQNVVQSYFKFPKVYGINNGIFPPKEKYEIINKDFETGRKNFLFFAGPGNIHKGLDLLLETFLHTDLHLHICQIIAPEFMRIFENELTQSENIHLHQYVPMRSKEFFDLTNKCNWVISASCAEGQPGAVLECMAYGLIPILSDANNIDLEDFGVILPVGSIEVMKNVVTACSKMDIQECKSRSIQTVNSIQKKFLAEHFLLNFKEAVSEIIYSSGKRSRG
jgi:glycosyltransferase involved in cell wall biosynthesis